MKVDNSHIYKVLSHPPLNFHHRFCTPTCLDHRCYFYVLTFIHSINWLLTLSCTQFSVLERINEPNQVRFLHRWLDRHSLQKLYPVVIADVSSLTKLYLVSSTMTQTLLPNRNEHCLMRYSRSTQLCYKISLYLPMEYSRQTTKIICFSKTLVKLNWYICDHTGDYSPPS